MQPASKCSICNGPHFGNMCPTLYEPTKPGFSSGGGGGGGHSHDEDDEKLTQRLQKQGQGQVRVPPQPQEQVREQQQEPQLSSSEGALRYMPLGQDLP